MHRKIISRFVRKRKTTTTSSSPAHAPTAQPSTTHATNDVCTIFGAATYISDSAINGSEIQTAGEIGLQIVEIVQTIVTNQEDCLDLDLVNRIAQILQPLCETLGGRTSEGLESRLKNDLPQFIGDLEIIRDNLEALSRNGLAARDGEAIMRCKNIVDEICERFPAHTMLPPRMDVAQTIPNQIPTMSCITTGAGQVYNAGRDQHIVYEISNISPNPALDKLSYVDGASWNSMLVCLPGTRVDLLQEVRAWAIAADVRRIFWLKGVAGCGKSAFAHTIAEIFDGARILGSSFFFDRNTSDRNTPRRLFGIIARDLARWHPALAADIVSILEEDPSLASASMSRQFANLILGPLSRHPLGGPMVIVIDAMDEASEDDMYVELLTILRNEVPKLPPMFRIFVTSRPTSILDLFLEGQEHTVSRAIEIHSPENMQDIEIYARSRMLEIAIWTEMSEGWPGSLLFDEFRRAAEGLFIWVSTVCNYLRTTHDPDGELRALVSTRSPRGLLPARKMDNLYTAILNACKWDDVAFVADYRLVMGAVMAAKRPISVTAWQVLLGDSLKRPVKRLVGSLGSLLTAGTTDASQPLRILHQSFRDFVTHRAREREDTMQFYVSEKENSRRLALPCLRVINQELVDTIPGTGYLDTDADEIPGIPEVSEVSEQLWYSCEFWTAHLADVTSPVTDALIGEISKAVSKRLTRWLEVVTAKGHFQGSLGVHAWLQSRAPEITDLYDTETQGRALFKFSRRLSYDDRCEEALTAAQEAVELRQKLAAAQPEKFNSDLAWALNSLSCRFTGLGRREDALTTIEEAVELGRKLPVERLAIFNPVLANSLGYLSNCLSDLGRREDALTAIWEALELYRKLAAELPAAFAPDLASSLNNLSLYLADLGRREDALTAVEMAVELYQALAAARPAKFNPDLAMGLINLSIRLSDLGHREDALTSIEEAIELHRKFAAERPATFNPDLAMSLNNLSAYLSYLGRREDALPAIEEAVELYRNLAAKRSAKFNPNLALSLSNLSKHLSDFGRREEALTASIEGVTLCRKLAAERPATFNPDLAMALNNLSAYFSHLGCREQALTANKEAVQLHRTLAAEGPEKFNPNLAMSLNNLAISLSNLGHREEALAAVTEAVALHRKLAAERPALFNPNLAASLRRLSSCLSSLGRQDEALLAKQEALELAQ